MVLAEAQRLRLIELLHQLLELNFISHEEMALMNQVTEKQLVVEAAARSLKRRDKYYEKKRDVFGDNIDWTDDKSVFADGRRRI